MPKIIKTLSLLFTVFFFILKIYIWQYECTIKVFFFHFILCFVFFMFDGWSNFGKTIWFHNIHSFYLLLFVSILIYSNKFEITTWFIFIHCLFHSYIYLWNRHIDEMMNEIRSLMFVYNFVKSLFFFLKLNWLFSNTHKLYIMMMTA